MTLDDVVIGLLLNREGIKLTSSENFIRPWLPPGQETLWNPGNADIAIQHYTREVKDIIENFNRINLPYKQKVLACLVNHGTEQIKYLQQVVKELATALKNFMYIASCNTIVRFRIDHRKRFICF